MLSDPYQNTTSSSSIKPCLSSLLLHFHGLLYRSTLLPPERAALCQTRLAAGGLAQHLRAAGADDDGLGVREDGGDGEAAGTLDVHEEGSWAGDEGLSSR